MKTKLKKAVETLCEELAKDKSEGSYYYSWQANIAVQFQDEYLRTFQKSLEEDKPELMSIHDISNQAAKNFLDLLIKR